MLYECHHRYNMYVFQSGVNHPINYTKGGYCCEITSFYCCAKGHYVIFMVHAGIFINYNNTRFVVHIYTYVQYIQYDEIVLVY